MQELANRTKAALSKKVEEELTSRNAARSTAEDFEQSKGVMQERSCTKVLERSETKEKFGLRQSLR
jgi:hypothetical protein